MSDITMCEDWDCPNQDTCWRLLAPPNKHKQAYQDFKFDYEYYEINGDVNNKGCDFYISTEELTFNQDK